MSSLHLLIFVKRFGPDKWSLYPVVLQYIVWTWDMDNISFSWFKIMIPDYWYVWYLQDLQTTNWTTQVSSVFGQTLYINTKSSRGPWISLPQLRQKEQTNFDYIALYYFITSHMKMSVMTVSYEQRLNISMYDEIVEQNSCISVWRI